MVCDVLWWQESARKRESAQRAIVDAHQFHELQDIEAHPDGFHDRGNIPTIHTGVSGLDHSLNVVISHWGTMTFESFSECLKETRGIPDAMVDLLLDQLWVQY